MQHARTCGLAGLESIVVDARLHDYAYDPQIEDRRADWLVSMIFAANAQDRIVPELLAHLKDSCEIHWDLVQRSRIALELSRRGIAPARQLTYALLLKSSNNNDVTGDEEVIALDGAKGLVHVAEFLGNLLDQNPDFWTHDNAIFSFDEIHGAGAARPVLDAAAIHSVAIARFLKHIDDRAAKNAAAKAQTVNEPSNKPRSNWLSQQSAQATISEIRRPEVRFGRRMFTEWGRSVSPEELVPVFDAMLLETDIERLNRYLLVFERVALPAFNPALLQYSDHADSSVRQKANLALSNYSHPDVRALALARIAQGRFTDDEIELLNNNFLLEDIALIEQHVKAPEHSFDAHRFLFSLITLFREHTVPESRNLMLFTYNRTPCSDCRRYAIEILLKTQQVPDWLIAECRDDSAKYIAALFSPAP